MLSYFETTDCIFVDKPEGWSTHSPGLGRRGLVEIYSSRLNLPLLVAHKLDTTTSGALVFAKTGSAAEHIRRCTQERRVKKSYQFLTDGKSERSEFELTSDVDKTGPALTQFTRVKRSPFFELWQAEPKTGKPHQIRIHAKEAGIPILGDSVYGGSPFPRLCLHAKDLEIPDQPNWSCPTPRLFERLGLLKDPELTRILCSIDKRQRLFGFLGSKDKTLRLMDFDSDGLALDLLGSTLWLHWYREENPGARDIERWTLVAWLLGHPMIIQKRVNRGVELGPATRWEIGAPSDQWQAKERNNKILVNYNFKKSQGESFGLFLDQRLNRSRMTEISQGKSVLNLFAYTGGFGMSAALSGASSTTTVDLSAATIDWAKENFRLNQIPELNNEFFAADCFFFLDRAIKKGRTWDLIICDPPIFSRSKEKVFRVEKDFAQLIHLCEQALNPGGWILFSTHYSGWDQKTLKAEIKKVFSGLVLDGQCDIDFSPEHPLKSFWLQKLN